MDDIGKAIVGILTAVIGVAIIATLVSKNSNTSGVVNAGGHAFSSALNTALMPVTGFGYTNTKF